MSDLVDLVSDKTLKNLDLPRLGNSETGIDRLYIEKSIQLVYLANDVYRVRHQEDILQATGILAAGQSFTAPINAKRLVFSFRFTYTTTATAGNRNISIQKSSKVTGDVITRYIQDSPIAASTTRIYQGQLGTTSGYANVAVELHQPISLEPEWFINIDDGANIDNADSVSWTIEYTEFQV